MKDPVLRTIDEFGHIEVTWPDPPRPFYSVAHEVIEDIIKWRNEYADMVATGGGQGRWFTDAELRARDERIIVVAWDWVGAMYDDPIQVLWDRAAKDAPEIIAAAEAIDG